MIRFGNQLTLQQNAERPSSSNFDLNAAFQAARPQLQQQQQLGKRASTLRRTDHGPVREHVGDSGFVRKAFPIEEKRVLQAIGSQLRDYLRAMNVHASQIDYYRTVPSQDTTNVVLAEYRVRLAGLPFRNASENAVTVVAGYDLSLDQFLPPEFFTTASQQKQLLTQANFAALQSGLYPVDPLPGPQRSLAPTYRPTDRIRTWGAVKQSPSRSLSNLAHVPKHKVAMLLRSVALSKVANNASSKTK